jgi:carbon storage regulator
MLVLSRREGESMMIGDDLMLTVSKIDPDRVQLQLSQKFFANRMSFFDPTRESWLRSGQSMAIADGVTCTLVAIKGDKVRLGFTVPKGIALHRKEVYDAIEDPKPLG